jgi:hypothetical protein
MSTTQGIKLDEETVSRLKSLAQQRNCSAHWLMRTAILDYLEREERYEREKRKMPNDGNVMCLPTSTSQKKTLSRG